MLTSDEKNRVWSFLKQNGASELMEISGELDIDSFELAAFLSSLTNEGFLTEDNGVFKIKIRLDRPFDVKRRRAQMNWDYGKIHEEMVRAQHGAEKEIPRKWMNPFDSSLPTQVDQGDRGTCVGWSSAIGVTLLKIAYLAKSGLHYPSPEEAAKAQHAVREKSHGLTCYITHEVYYPDWISAGFNYWNARDMAKATYPEGSFLIDWIKAAKARGCVTEENFWTSITPYCAPDFFPWEWDGKPRDALIAKGSEFLIIGYAQTTDFDMFCRMIYEQGCAWIDINIFANYQSKGCTGLYPEPKGDMVGSHAQCAIGYDLDKREIYFKQSWGKNWSDKGGITENYWDRAAGLGLAAIGIDMKIAAQKLYTKVSVQSNVNASFYFDGTKRAETRNFTLSVERDSNHSVKAVPMIGQNVNEKELYQEFKAINEEYLVDFVFTQSSLADRIKKIFKDIFDNIFRRK